jgi:hypothetical protein
MGNDVDRVPMATSKAKVSFFIRSPYITLHESA